MMEDEINMSWFNLVTSSDTAPSTGIYINLDTIHNFQAKSTFRFTQISGKIAGEVYTSPTIAKGEYIATVRIYKSDAVALAGIDWDTVTDTDTIHDILLALEPEEELETNPDGTYEIALQPGIYDVLIDKPGYLDHIYLGVEVETAQTTTLELADLLAGDIDKDGIVGILDLSLLLRLFGTDTTDTSFEQKYDFNEDEIINILDQSWLLNNYGEVRKIIKKEEI